MTKIEEVQQLLAELEKSNDESEQRRIRRELRNRGHYVSKRGNLIAGVVMSRRDGPAPPASVVTTLRLEADLHRRLQLLAADEGTSANAIVEQVVRRHLDELGVPSRLNRDK